MNLNKDISFSDFKEEIEYSLNQKLENIMSENGVTDTLNALNSIKEKFKEVSEDKENINLDDDEDIDEDDLDDDEDDLDDDEDDLDDDEDDDEDDDIEEKSRKRK